MISWPGWCEDKKGDNDCEKKRERNGLMIDCNVVCLRKRVKRFANDEGGTI